MGSVPYTVIQNKLLEKKHIFKDMARVSLLLLLIFACKIYSASEEANATGADSSEMHNEEQAEQDEEGEEEMEYYDYEEDEDYEDEDAYDDDYYDPVHGGRVEL